MMRKQMQNLWQCQNHMVSVISTEQFQGLKFLLFHMYILNCRFVWVQYIIDKDSSCCCLVVAGTQSYLYILINYS